MSTCPTRAIRPTTTPGVARDRLPRPLAPNQSGRKYIGLWLKNAWDTTYVVANHDPRNFQPGSIGGHAAPSMLLTGAIGKDGPAQFDGWEMTAGGPSIDTHIAVNQPGADQVKFKPLVLRATRRESPSAYISFKGAPVTNGVQNTNGVQDDPVALFKDMFGDGSIDTGDMERVIAGKRHILDFSKGHLTQMRQRFGKCRAHKARE